MTNYHIDLSLPATAALLKHIMTVGTGYSCSWANESLYAEPEEELLDAFMVEVFGPVDQYLKHIPDLHIAFLKAVEGREEETNRVHEFFTNVYRGLVLCYVKEG